MPAALLPKEEVLERLTSEFRRWGYDGATLSKLSAATGLVKASLYHYFPKGKPDMARAVLEDLGGRFDEMIMKPLQAEGAPRARLAETAKGLIAFYQEGRVACALEVFSLGTARQLFGEQIKARFISLRDTLARLLAETGLDLGTAVRRAELGIAMIQGGLVTSRGMDDPEVFRNAVKALPAFLFKEA